MRILNGSAVEVPEWVGTGVAVDLKSLETFVTYPCSKYNLVW